jgi:hypothetical protein
MSTQIESGAGVTKDEAYAGDVLHLERGNVDPDAPKQNVGYEYVDFEHSRQKSPLERKLVWKIDLLLVPVLSLIYFIAYLVSHPSDQSLLVAAPSL